jgi:hypothetical protein
MGRLVVHFLKTLWARLWTELYGLKIVAVEQSKRSTLLVNLILQQGEYGWVSYMIGMPVP